MPNSKYRKNNQIGEIPDLLTSLCVFSWHFVNIGSVWSNIRSTFPASDMSLAQVKYPTDISTDVFTFSINVNLSYESSLGGRASINTVIQRLATQHWQTSVTIVSECWIFWLLGSLRILGVRCRILPSNSNHFFLIMSCVGVCLY